MKKNKTIFNLNGRLEYVAIVDIAQLKEGDIVFTRRQTGSICEIIGFEDGLVRLNNTSLVDLNENYVFKLGLVYMSKDVAEKILINNNQVKRFSFQYDNLTELYANFYIDNNGEAVLEEIPTNWEKITALNLGDKIYFFSNGHYNNRIIGYYYCGIHPAGSKTSIILCDDASISDGLKGFHINVINKGFFTTNYDEAVKKRLDDLKEEIKFWEKR